MPKRVLSIGQCGPDDAALRRLLARHFDVEIHSADLPDEALRKTAEVAYDLVLVNRKLDADYSDGLEIIRALKARPETSGLPVMLITNYEEHHAQAMASGAERGFGKLEYGRAETIERLSRFLAAKPTAAP